MVLTGFINALAATRGMSDQKPAKTRPALFRATSHGQGEVPFARELLL